MKTYLKFSEEHTKMQNLCELSHFLGDFQAGVV